jgi:hypothetical protein
VSLTEDLDQLAISIRQLQARWDMFFSGVEKRPPNEAHSRVEKLIREYDRSVIRNNTDRFRFQGLTSRFNTLNELWQKRLRAREEGRAFGVHGLRADELPPPPPPEPEPQPRATPRPGGSEDGFRVGDAERDGAAVRALYDRFVEERQRTGEGAPPTYESFHELIGKQTARILGAKGARAVDFRLDTKDGKVALKAKVVK